MRLSIVLTLCFLAVASAATLVKRDNQVCTSNCAAKAPGKRNIFDDFNKMTRQEFEQKLQNALKNLFAKKPEAQQPAAEAAITKRDVASDALQLINSMNDPAKFAQQFIKVLAQLAVQGRPKRALAEDLKKFAEAGKQRTQDAFKQLMDLFSSFKKPAASDETSTEKTVSKRDISEDLQKITLAGREKIQAALKQLQELFEQFKGGFNKDKSSPTVTKRDVSETLKNFSETAQEKTKSAFQKIKDALASLFGMKKPVVDQVEDSTEVPVSKRSIQDDIQKFNKNLQEQTKQALDGFKNAFSDFFNQFRKPTKSEPEPEATTESS